MLGIYFSGTGNSRYALETFLRHYNSSAKTVAIEDKSAAKLIGQHQELVFSYPVQYSNIPKMLKDFIEQNSRLWNGKRIFVIATMALFSGDGAGILARHLQRYGAHITGGLHLKMPDSISDVKALKRPLAQNKRTVKKAEKKIACAANRMKHGKPPQEGIGLLPHFAGLFGQRLYFMGKMKRYSNKLKVDPAKCIGCGRCAALCPMCSIRMEKGKAKAGDRCTMCYRCVNSCPKQAITLLGKKVVAQGTIETYLAP